MYSRLLAQYPLTTKCITSGFMFSLGDAITQIFIEKKKDFDYKRNFNLILTGTFYLGPCLHVWYSKLLPKAVGAVTTNTKFAPFVGMLFDQLAFAPLFLTGFYIFANFVKDFTVKSAQFGWEEAKKKMKDTMITNWKIWPIATLINLTYVPVQYRVLFANFIGLFWNMYLSLMANS